MAKHVRDVKKVINDVEHYYCSRCSTYKVEEEMYIGEASLKRRDLSCIACSKQRAKEYRNRNYVRATLSTIKGRAKRKGIEFSITEDDVIIPDICPLLGIPITFGGNYTNRNNSPSIDRIDNSKGYTSDNIRVISFLANTIKRDLSKELLITFSENIVKYMT